MPAFDPKRTCHCSGLMSAIGVIADILKGLSAGVKFNNLLARRDLDELRELFPSERLFQKFSGDRVLHH
jgi:hypothetical protein